MSSQGQPEDTLETGGEPAARGGERMIKPAREFLRQKAERFEFSLLATEDADDLSDDSRAHILRRRQSLKPERHSTLWKNAKAQMRTKADPYFDLPEDHKVVMEAEGIKRFRVPSLLECQAFLSNKEADAYKRRACKPLHMFSNLLLNIFAAFTIWLISMTSLETLVVVGNACGAASFFGDSTRSEQW